MVLSTGWEQGHRHPFLRLVSRRADQGPEHGAHSTSSKHLVTARFPVPPRVEGETEAQRGTPICTVTLAPEQH